MLNFTKIKTNIPKSTRKQIAKELATSNCTVKRYRIDINKMSFLFRIEAKKNFHRPSVIPSRVRGRKRDSQSKTCLVTIQLIKLSTITK